MPFLYSIYRDNNKIASNHHYYLYQILYITYLKICQRVFFYSYYIYYYYTLLSESIAIYLDSIVDIR